MIQSWTVQKNPKFSIVKIKRIKSKKKLNFQNLIFENFRFLYCDGANVWSTGEDVVECSTVSELTCWGVNGVFVVNDMHGLNARYQLIYY